MNRLAVTLVTLCLPLLLNGCAWLQKNPDSGEPMADITTQRAVDEVLACLTEEAGKHHASFKTTAIPQGSMLDFGDSNVVKVRRDNDVTTYRFYAGKRHVGNLWLENASKTCAPAST
ncbi:hypothetical protein QS306_14915 [Paraburkholderia bonniea]|uniref:hypothetical protein n=1 Tax=Paraburkholderia bonniea TaxID=2152891 RepID=UPI0012917A0F|nr:hypothetical protein [Paraburkholderia bonniea]WJF92052.1 hypothetical protein QS306_14915 [Paraburkholderia bonniea]WJF95372.1 hypothetical protein QS308_14920 [Paraburkholderia bonniea]